MTTYTTLNKIKQIAFYEYDYEKLLKFLGKTKADDEPLAITTIAESNGVKDAVWCLRTLPESDKNKIVLFACDCAESVLHIFENKYPDNNRPRKAIQAARDFTEGKISKEELEKAADAAYAASAARASAASAARASAAYAASAASAARASAYAAYASAYAAYAASATAEREKQLTFLIKHFG